MSVRSILLRLLLVVAFVSNTMGSTMASVRMGDMAATAAVQSAKAAAASCHEHHHATLSDEQSSAPAGTTESPPPSDCCKSGACRCACVHHAPALTVALGFYPLIIDRDRSARPMSSGHAAPALPHLIRPPIG